MSYELVGIIILGVMGISQIGGLLYLKRGSEEQLRRNLALDTLFQKWNAEKSDSISHRCDQILELLQKREL